MVFSGDVVVVLPNICCCCVSSHYGDILVPIKILVVCCAELCGKLWW